MPGVVLSDAVEGNRRAGPPAPERRGLVRERSDTAAPRAVGAVLCSGRGCGGGTEPGLDRSNPRGDGARAVPVKPPLFSHSLNSISFVHTSPVLPSAHAQGSGRLSGDAASIVEEGHLIGRLRRHVGPIDFAVFVPLPQSFHGRGDPCLNRALRRGGLCGRCSGRRVVEVRPRWVQAPRPAGTALPALSAPSTSAAAAARHLGGTPYNGRDSTLRGMNREQTFDFTGREVGELGPLRVAFCRSASRSGSCRDRTFGSMAGDWPKADCPLWAERQRKQTFLDHNGVGHCTVVYPQS